MVTSLICERLASPINLTHAARADQREDPVRSKRGPSVVPEFYCRWGSLPKAWREHRSMISLRWFLDGSPTRRSSRAKRTSGNTSSPRRWWKAGRRLGLLSFRRRSRQSPKGSAHRRPPAASHRASQGMVSASRTDYRAHGRRAIGLEGWIQGAHVRCAPIRGTLLQRDL
jgi:hypothetical protein